MIRLEDDLFIIPIENGNIIYSPLRRGVFWADDEAASVVHNYLKGYNKANTDTTVYQFLEQLKNMEVKPLFSRSINDGSKMVVILSQICNLECSYCYAQEARSKEILDFNKLLIAINHVICSSDKKKFSLTFIGGGEPLIVWDLIKRAIDYSETIKGEKIISYWITTNLTLLTEEILDYAQKYDIRFGVSYEILKDIQDKQRPFHSSSRSTFDVIHHNIKLLMDRKIKFNIRSTITNLNVERMPEMARYVGENYPVLRKVHFEPVTDPVINDLDFYNKYIRYFIEARSVGKEYNLNVYNSISNSVFNIKERFCGGEFCITPTGSIVTCHRISSNRDSFYDLFHVGDIITSEGIVINDCSLKRYLDFSNQKRDCCKSCFAYWHCAGICPMERCCLSVKQIESKCIYTQTLVKKILEEVINTNNTDLFAYN